MWISLLGLLQNPDNKEDILAENLGFVVQRTDVNFGYKLKRLLETNPGKIITSTHLANAMGCRGAQITGAVTHFQRQSDCRLHYVRDQIPSAPRGVYYYGQDIDTEALTQMLDKYTGADELVIPW